MMTKRQRREIDAALKTEIASEEVQASVADLARYEVRPNQIYAWKTQPLEQAARGIDGGAGLDAEPRHRRVYPASFRGPCTLVERTCRPPTIRYGGHGIRPVLWYARGIGLR
jgi:hypothetical protein